MSFFDKAKEAFGDLKDKVTGDSDDPQSRIDDAADTARDRAGGAIDKAADEARARVDDAADTAANEGASYLDRAGDTAAKGIDNTGDWADSTTRGRFSEQIDPVERGAEEFVDPDGSAGTQER